MIFKDEYENFGYEIFGPFLKTFTEWLCAKIIEQNAEKVFFFSRDGFMMQKACCLHQGFLEREIKHEYVYFSRNSLRRALLWDCGTYEESLKYLSNQRFISFSELASYYGIQENEKDIIEKSFDILWTHNFLQSALPQNEKVKRFYSAYKAKINAESKRQYHDIVLYLKQIGMQGNVAIVDIGWHGAMQYYLELLLEKSGIDACITGYYIGINVIYSIKGNTYGFLFSKENLEKRKKVLCALGLLEKLFQSLEGSTDDYVNKQGIVVPVLKGYEYQDDLQIQGYIKSLQNGALRYLRNPPDKKTSWKPLVAFGMNPTSKRLKLFSFFYNVDGEKLYFLPQKSIFQYRLKEFLVAFSNSCWKTGFMKAAFKLPFPYFWIYNVLRK